jgi:glycosyltransferase involved in cell wall biosynthesis
MKILYLCPDLGIPVLGRKGAAVHVREMVAALGRAGHQVVLAAQMLNKSPWVRPAALDVPLIQVRPSLSASGAVQALKEFNELMGVQNSLPGELRRVLYNKELATELHRRFENDPPDFIYERASLYATGGVALARSLGAPLVLELNAPLADEQTAYRATGFAELAARAEQWTLTQADAVITVSAQLADHARSLGVEPGRIHVQPNGVDSERFHPALADPRMRERLQLDGGQVVGFVGGLRPWHGVESLPGLLERLAESHPDVRLVIAGDGPLRNKLEQEFARRGLVSRVTFTGSLPHEEIPAVIRQFDVAVAPYPAPQHAFYFSPLKLFEYMACGIPVVAPELGQIAEVMRHGETGLMYRPGDLEGLTGCCHQLLEDGALRQRVGKAAADQVAAQFTWDHNARRTVEVARGLRERAAAAAASPGLIAVQPGNGRDRPAE